MSKKICIACDLELPSDAFRANSKEKCTWCQWESPRDRARARYKDKVKADRKRSVDDKRLQISEEDFVAWYLSEKDQCHYCGTERGEIKALRLRKGRGYCVSWDIDRKDSYRPYEKGNMVLSCSMCNTAKASYLTEEEAFILGSAVREIVEQRLGILQKQLDRQDFILAFLTDVR